MTSFCYLCGAPFGHACVATGSRLTPDHQVRGRLVDAPGVARHASVGAGVGDVRGRDEKAARLQQGEPGQLH